MSDTRSQPGATALAPSTTAEPSVHCRVFRAGRPTPAPIEFSQLSEVLKEAGCFVWFDVVDPGPRDLAVLEQEFDLHPLAIEDAVQAHQRAKIDEYGTYWFIVVHGATVSPAGLQFSEIAVFAGRRFVVTVRHSPAYPLDEIERRWLDHPEPLRHDSGFLLYTILDTVVDGYFPVAEDVQERVDALEEMLFRREPLQDDVLREIFALKKEVQQFRRAAVPMRDILNPILRRDLALFPEEELAYYRDVYDHAIRVIDGLDAVRDLVNSALEIHLSVVANRQNEVAKQLTIIATIFLPLSFITGFFGQNFGYLVAHLTGGTVFWVLGMGSQLVSVALLVLYFKRKGWV